MKLSNRISIGVAILAILLFPFSVNADQLRGYLTSSLLPTALDTNGDGVTASALYGSGKASPIGKFTFTGRSEVLPWDFASFCSPTEVKVKFLIHSGVISAANGDLLFYVLDADNPANEFCPNIVDGVSFRGTQNYVIVGGTGRFTGATGYFTFEGRGTSIINLAGTPVGGAAEGPISGEIFLATSMGDDDEDGSDD
jgi:hypothetical protein